MKRIRDALVTGLLVLVPLLATINLLLWFFRTLDGTIRSIFPTSYLPFDFRGLGLLLALALLIVTGIFTQVYVGKWFLNLFDFAISRVPMAGGIYLSIKKFLETIFNPNDGQFKGVVLVQFPREGIYSIGFRTGKPDPKIQSKEKKILANIFVPCTPNPTSGFYILVPEAELIALEMSVQEAFKIIISTGLITSEDTRPHPLNPFHRSPKK